MSTAAKKRLVLCCLTALLTSECARQHADNPSSDANRAGSAAAHGANGTASAKGAAGTAAVASESARVGARAVATFADLTESEPVIEGMGTFTQTATGVDLELRLRGCERGKSYAVFIQQGVDCSSDTVHGAHWDSPRGENIDTISCTGNSGGGRTYYSRLKTAAKPWTIGSPAASDLLQHAVVVYDESGSQPLACGTVMRADDVEPVPDEVKKTEPKPALRAVVGGLCLAKLVVRNNMQECPNPAELIKCASVHCALDACVTTCASYLACLETESDPCQPTSCEITPECAGCQGEVASCVFGFCPEVIACAAPPSPDGPCSQLEACCAMQGDDAEECLDMVHLLERISGDPSCFGAMHDWDTLAHLKVPCKFQ